jgi:hypothetical protein
VLDRSGLAGKAAALDRGDDVILAAAIGDVERLVDHQSKRRPREIDFLLAPVDGDLARSGLQPDAGDRVLAAAGRVGAALLVELLLAEGRFCGGRRERFGRSFRFRLGSRRRGSGLGRAERGRKGSRDCRPF